MIIDYHDGHPSEIRTLLNANFSILVPFGWNFVEEQFDPARFCSVSTFNAVTHAGEPLAIALHIHATNKGVDYLPKSSVEWAQLHIPVPTAENDLLHLYESTEKYGRHWWHCTTFMWKEADGVVVKREIWSHLHDPAVLISFTGHTTKDDKPLMRFFASNICR